MPELPEVETTLRGITPHIHQKTISKVIIRQPSLRWHIPAHLKATLKGQCILSLSRRAKYLLLETEKGHLIIHLGMSGRLRIVKDAIKAQKHDHVDIIFSNGTLLRYNDPRRFGAILWTEDAPEQHALLRHLGPEPLSKNFNERYLNNYIKTRKKPIKALIMDNKVVVGVGNIYAAEALFKSRILPGKQANTLSSCEIKLLVTNIKSILKTAIKQGGTTLKDFLSSDGKPGYFSQQLKVYGRQGEPCYVCNNTLLAQIIGQRNTVFCNTCQC